MKKLVALGCAVGLCVGGIIGQSSTPVIKVAKAPAINIEIPEQETPETEVIYKESKPKVIYKTPKKIGYKIRKDRYFGIGRKTA